MSFFDGGTSFSSVNISPTKALETGKVYVPLKSEILKLETFREPSLTESIVETRIGLLSVANFKSLTIFELITLRVAPGSNIAYVSRLLPFSW